MSDVEALPVSDAGPIERDVVLKLRDLRVSFPTEDGDVQAVRGIDLEVRQGELAGAGVVPHTPYFGSVDSTPVSMMATTVPVPSAPRAHA